MRYLLILLFFVSGCGIQKDIENTKGPNKKESAFLHTKRIDYVEWIKLPDNFEHNSEYNKLTFNSTKYIEILNGKYKVGLSKALVSNNKEQTDYYAYYLEIFRPINHISIIVDDLLIDLKYISSGKMNKPIDEIIDYDDNNQTLEFDLGKSTLKCKLILVDDYN